MALFRLLHASDPHMAAVPFTAGPPLSGFLKGLAKYWRQVSHDPAPLRAFVQFAHLNQQCFDAVLVSGDLSTTGDTADLQAAYDLYTAPPANPTTCLTAAGEPTLRYWASNSLLDLLPGNHDRFRSVKARYRPGGRRFDTVFCPPGGLQFWCAGQGVAHGIALLRSPWVLHVVKADFTLRRYDGGKPFYWLPGWLGQGRVKQSVLDLLTAATTQARDEYANQGWSPITLWAIHFDPFTTDATLSLLESEKLAQAAKDLNVPAILCGHTHESKLKPLSDATCVFACGTTAQADSPQWDCQAIEVDADDAGNRPPTIRVQLSLRQRPVPTCLDAVGNRRDGPRRPSLLPQHLYTKPGVSSALFRNTGHLLWITAASSSAAPASTTSATSTSTCRATA
jgi:hypothetical protein